MFYTQEMRQVAPGTAGEKVTEMNEWTAEAVTDSIPAITREIGRELDALDCSAQARRKINVALDELLSNIAYYAYAPGIGKVTVQMRYDETDGTVFLTFIDSGIPYNPLEKADPDITLAAGNRPVGGLGVLMVKKKMDGMEYRRENGQNILTVRKRIRED